MIDLGAYAAGRDPLLDEALRRAPAMETVLLQGTQTSVPLPAALAALQAAFGDTP